MNNGRRVELDVTYNNAPFAGQVGAEIESLTYVDNAADDSDSIDITLDAQDSKWLHGWLPEEGATLRPRIIGRDWNGPGDTHVMECGLFILDDVAYQDAPTTLQVGGVSKPSDTDFSELERETIWKNTSIKRIGESIAGRYGLGFTYDADDYDIECDEQDETDSSYYNTLCKNYGLILKVYAKRLWVYDRERYKGKRAVQDFDRTNIIPGSLSYNTTLPGNHAGHSVHKAGVPQVFNHLPALRMSRSARCISAVAFCLPQYPPGRSASHALPLPRGFWRSVPWG